MTPPLTQWLCREAPESVPEEPRETLCARVSLRVNWKAPGMSAIYAEALASRLQCGKSNARRLVCGKMTWTQP